MQAELIKTVAVGNRLGEAVLWDAETNAVWWTDIISKKLYRYTFVDENLSTWDTPEELACFSLVDKRFAKGSLLLAGFASGFAYFEPNTGEVQWLHKIEETNLDSRLNDGRTDRQGRFWAGSLAPQGTSIETLGALYSLDGELKLDTHLRNIKISNSLCWSPNSNVLYHADTVNQTVQRYSFDSNNGVIGGVSEFVRTESDCYPDGSIVDAQGYLLNAQWGGSKVVRYSPSGEVDFELRVPVSQPTCVAIGGPNNDLLFVTSAKEDLETPEAQAGDLFIYKTDLVGLNEVRFKPKLMPEMVEIFGE